jgi:hypothetical protein
LWNAVALESPTGYHDPLSEVEWLELDWKTTTGQERDCLCRDDVHTIREKKTSGVVKDYGIGAERIDAAATEAVKV